MGKLQITTAEIKTRILRVCHVKKKRIYTVSHVKTPYLTCVSCALYFSKCWLQYTLANGAASVSSYSHRSAAESWTDKEDVQPRYTPFHVLPLPRHRLAGRC